MTHADKTSPSQSESVAFEFDLPHQKQNFGGARYGWRMMGGNLVDLLGRIS